MHIHRYINATKGRVCSSHCFDLTLVGLMVEHKADSGPVPRPLHQDIIKTSLVSTMVPLGQVTGAITTLGGRLYLLPQHTSLTVEPGY